MIAPSTAWLCALLGAAIGLAFAIGFFARRPPRPNLYRCRRCGHSFHRSPDRPYPRRCPTCKSAEW